MRLRHLGRLVGDVGAYSVATRTFWMAPLVAVLVTLAVVVTATAAVVPYAVYTVL